MRPKGKTIAQLKTAEGEKKSDKTIKGIFVNVGTFVRWINDETYPINSELHSALTRHKVPKGQGKRRRPFDDDDLIALFHSDNYRLGKWTRASEFWTPLIALFTGMQRNEIIQLEVDDVYKKDGRYIIDINDRGNDKRLKEIASENDETEDSTGRPRKVPIHQQIVDLGFLDFVAYQKSKGETRLFPCEKRNGDGKFEDYGKRFRRWRDKVEAGPRDKKEFRDFHSFRHLMKTQLRNKVKDEGIIDDILGHSSKDRSEAGKTYDHSDRIEFNAEAINTLKFDCINFNSIRPWKHHSFAKK